VPTSRGFERIVMRILHKTSVLLGLEDLGFAPREYGMMDDLINRPDGIVLVTGPTGSGKTTTLYACLNRINEPSVNILTAEDPVEYEIGGLHQVHVHPSIGLTFASALRAFLRQDPDVIMVGEIRDKETAEIAIHASLTGHLVLSTIHTNDAAGAVTRLVEMEIEPFLVRSSVIGILAQRLVRILCPTARSRTRPRTTSSPSWASTPSASTGRRAAQVSPRYQVHGHEYRYVGQVMETPRPSTSRAGARRAPKRASSAGAASTSCCHRRRRRPAHPQERRRAHDQARMPSRRAWTRSATTGRARSSRPDDGRRGPRGDPGRRRRRRVRSPMLLCHSSNRGSVAVFEYRGILVGSASRRRASATRRTRRRCARRSAKDGILLTSRDEAKAAPRRRRSATLFSFGSRPVGDIAVMTRQLATLIGAGIPLFESLNALIEQVEKRCSSARSRTSASR
jgi:energy-coupling factor transporter ATP-binding protein EcfA2